MAQGNINLQKALCIRKNPTTKYDKKVESLDVAT